MIDCPTHQHKQGADYENVFFHFIQKGFCDARRLWVLFPFITSVQAVGLPNLQFDFIFTLKCYLFNSWL